MGAVVNKGGFSWKRATGITGAKSRVSRATGIPLTKSGRQRKLGRAITGGGCLLPLLLAGVALLSLVACSGPVASTSAEDAAGNQQSAPAAPAPAISAPAVGELSTPEDEAEPVPPVEPVQQAAPVVQDYIGNKNSKKFHYPGCGSVGQMKESNKVRLDSREEAIRGGYDPCGNCNP